MSHTDWVAYHGVNKPRKGQRIGWRHVATGDVRYQDMRPSDSSADSEQSVAEYDTTLSDVPGITAINEHVSSGLSDLLEKMRLDRGEPLPNNPTTEEAVNKAMLLEDIAYQFKHERLSAVDSDGNVLFEKDGDEDSVRFDHDEIKKMYGAEVVTHNHPGGWAYPVTDQRHVGNSLSIPDMTAATTMNAREMRAISRGYRYSLRIPDGWVEREYDKFKKLMTSPYASHSQDDREMETVFREPWNKLVANLQNNKSDELKCKVLKAEFVARSIVHSVTKSVDAQVQATWQARVDKSHREVDYKAAMKVIEYAEARHADDVAEMVAKVLGWEYTKEPVEDELKNAANEMIAENLEPAELVS